MITMEYNFINYKRFCYENSLKECNYNSLILFKKLINYVNNILYGKEV